MATSGSYNMSSSYGTIRVEWWLISQSTSGNYSRVGWRAVATWASNTWLQVYSCNIWVNGAQVLARGSAQTWGGQFASGELNIGHNSNGTKNFGSNGNAAIYTAATNASGSGGWDLPNIARWASITGNGGNRTDETIYNTTVSFSNPANVQVGVKMEILGSPGINPFAQRTNISTASSGTYTWALTSTELEQLRTAMNNRTSATLRYTVFSTVSGETQFSYQDRTITIVNANPVFTDFTFKDSNAATVAITGNDQFIVQGYSTLQAFISAANKMQTLKEADPVRYRFQIGSIDVTENYIATDLTKELGTVGLNTTANLVVSAVDTRNLTTPVTKSVTILPYQAPQVNATAERVNNFETSTKIHVEGVISRLTVGGVDKNVVNTTSGLQYRYKKTDTGTWGAWQNIASSTSSGNVSMTDFYVNLDRNFAWNVEFRLTDAITNTSLALIVGVGIPIFRIGVDGKTYNNEQVLMPSHIGQVIMSTTLTTAADVAEIYGGTWVEFGKGRTVVGVDTAQTEFNTVEKTGGHKQLQAHTHEINATGGGDRRIYTDYIDGGSYSTRRIGGGNTTARSNPVTAQSTGGGDSQNLQPYITLYMWKRTA